MQKKKKKIPKYNVAISEGFLSKEQLHDNSVWKCFLTSSPMLSICKA